jgi:hypothetical protein
VTPPSTGTGTRARGWQCWGPAGNACTTNVAHNHREDRSRSASGTKASASSPRGGETPNQAGTRAEPTRQLIQSADLVGSYRLPLTASRHATASTVPRVQGQGRPPGQVLPPQTGQLGARAWAATDGMAPSVLQSRSIAFISSPSVPDTSVLLRSNALTPASSSPSTSRSWTCTAISESRT